MWLFCTVYIISSIDLYNKNNNINMIYFMNITFIYSFSLLIYGGYMLYDKYKEIVFPSKETLELELEKALMNEDYETAHTIQKKLKRL